MSLSNHLKCTIEGDSSWFHLLNLNQLVSLQVRSRVTQRCQRMVLYQNDRSGGFHRCAAGLVLVCGCEIPFCTKVELLKEHTRDKVRRRLTLLVTARVCETTGQAPMY